MFDPSQTSPGEWFNCLNVGDDHIEDKKERRKDEDLLIPGFSVVEIVGIRRINDDHFVHEVRLLSQQSEARTDSDYVGSNSNQAFTGPGDILKGHAGRMKFPPAMCRFKEDSIETANDKIFGRYKAPERVPGSKFTDKEHDAFEQQERLFGTGNVTKLLGSPTGELQLPQDDDNSGQFTHVGWNVLGIYKYTTGEKTKGKKDDEDGTKNLLAYVAPAAQSPPPSVVFLTKEDITNQVFQTGSVAVDLLEYVDPRSASWNHKMLIDFSGAFGHEYAFEISTGFQGDTIGPFLISTDGKDMQAALETLPWVGKGNVTVNTPGVRTGRYIIEFVGDLAGTRVNGLFWRRVITIDPNPPINLIHGAPEIPPTPLYEIPEYDFKLIPGNHSVLITPASRPLTNQQRWYGAGGYYGGFYGGWGYGYGYYPGGDYGYFGGWGGGPLGYFGGNYFGGLGYNYFGSGGFYGPGGYNVTFYVGPYEFDADGNPSSVGPYNSQGYNANGFDKNGFDPGGFDASGLNADGKTWGYYGVWGHLHTGTPTHANGSDHKNDHGILNFYANNVFQYTAAGSFGIANWSEGGGYVVVELEQREFWMHVQEEAPTQIVTY